MTENNLAENKILPRLQKLLNIMEKEEQSSFYRKKFQTAGVNAGTLKTLADLPKFPLTHWIDFFETKLWERLYKRNVAEGKIVKIINEYRRVFLIQRNLSDLYEEDYEISKLQKPQILFGNIHEALEKSLLFYENNVLPLIGEPNNFAISTFSAKERNIDSLMIGERLFCSYVNHLKEVMDVKDLKIMVVGQFIDPSNILQLVETLKINSVRFIMELPETGPFAYACPEALVQGKLVFHPDKNSFVENEGALIITKVIHMPTPVIRYQADIFAQPEKTNCNCEAEKSFVLI